MTNIEQAFKDWLNSAENTMPTGFHAGWHAALSQRQGEPVAYQRRVKYSGENDFGIWHDCPKSTFDNPIHIEKAAIEYRELFTSAPAPVTHWYERTLFILRSIDGDIQHGETDIDRIRTKVNSAVEAIVAAPEKPKQKQLSDDVRFTLDAAYKALDSLGLAKGSREFAMSEITRILATQEAK